MFPEKVNVTFAQIDAPDAVTAVVWERGVGLTLACGSAACATVVSGARLGLIAPQGRRPSSGRRTRRSSGANRTTTC